MVEASGLSLNDDEDPSPFVEDSRPPNLWRVVFSSRVVVREKPSVASRPIGLKRCGDVVNVDWTLASLWIKLRDEPGWMLAHGAQLGLGPLVLPHDDDVGE
mmetsp:Transcript_1693/g.5061  ORF Transcript_1693/g.5061 Transcript_1693/m.5061 type:complete len:101 (+) Transcript_1693:228-530(+)